MNLKPLVTAIALASALSVGAAVHHTKRTEAYFDQCAKCKSTYAAAEKEAQKVKDAEERRARIEKAKNELKECVARAKQAWREAGKQ